MERYPLKVVVEGLYDVKLYTEDGETTTVLNIKRGIVSTLAVPLLEEDRNKNMPTIHGMCKTQFTVNAREEIATDISLTRDLSRCDKFNPIRDHTSPLALISGMHYPLAQLVRSSQTCNYKFDNEKKHMTSGSCTENHILIPFSHKFYKLEGKLIPEIFSVAEFMAAQLGDCTGDKDETFMKLRVIGNMASAVIPAGPALRGSVMQCVNQPAASPAVQQAAIQVFRLTPVPAEVRGVFMQVLLDNASPMQKRIAAYLVLMKDPQPSELTQLANALPNEQDQQVKSFVISHMTNILSSSVPETQELRQKIRDALQGNEIGPTMDPTKFSRNYKIGSLEGNMIFEDTSYLPKEVMLEMTLKAFGFDVDMMEIGMEGKGFEPTVDALFGQSGFFPDIALKTMYFVSDNMPQKVNEILQNIMPAYKRDRMNRQVSHNFMREIGRNINKLVRELKSAESPEAMVYLRLLGNELGYLKTSEIEGMLLKALMTKADNTFFAHYIFMDNEFFLPTVTGVPLRVSLSGTFAPGIKGYSCLTFTPSAGIEFVTRFGSHIPEYANSGLEMYTNLFHESGLNARIFIGPDRVKLTIPAPTGPTKLINLSNKLMAVTGSEVKTIPPMVMDKVDVRECTPVFAGMKYCSELQYTDAFSQETAPYFPFTGDSNRFAVELHPTGEVTEYTATVAYDLLTGSCFSLKAMKEGMLQVQLLVPSISADATVTANMKRDQELELELKSEIRLPGTTSEQKITMKYGTITFHQLEVYAADYPSIQNFKVPDMPEITLPETLFLNTETKAVYHFNTERVTIVIPLPLGGKSTQELNFPPALTTPNVVLPQFGLEIISVEIPIPELVFPESLTFPLPLFGKAEVVTAMRSNLYNIEASVAAGKDVVETPSYSAKFDVKGTSPIEILSMKMEGSGMLATTDSIKAQLKSSLAHKFIEASFSIVEDATITDKINMKSSSKMEAKSPFGLNVVFEHDGMVGINTEEMSADNKFEGMFAAGPIYGKTTSTQSFNIFPFRPEAKIDSNVQLDSTFVKAQNTIAATLLNGELSVVSNTNAFEDTFTHVADLSFKDSKLSLKCDANAFAFGMKIRNQAEASAGAGNVAMKMETNADHSDNRVYSLLTASLDVNGLVVNSDANIKLLENEATHKASLKMNKDGLTTSGTTTLQSPLSFENTFDVSYADMIANAKCGTTGKLFGTHMSHNTELEVIGLAARFSNDARFNSQPVRFDHTIRCSIVPFDFNLDAIFNADGDVTMYGKHSAQLYGKLLVKAQPLAFASSHECRASVNQQLNNGLSLQTTFDNNMDNVLSLQEQKTSFRMKSKLNEHAFNQDLSIYNTAERTGIEASGTILTNIINSVSADNQEFTISGFLKYDKSTNSHMIYIPIFESFAVFMDRIKVLAVHVAEALQDYINNDEVRAKLEALPEQISDFVAQMNIEDKAVQLKQYFLDFTQNYAISMEDVEASLRNLKIAVQKILADLTVYIQNFVSLIKETFVSANFPEVFAQQIQNLLNAINEEYDIKGMLVYVPLTRLLIPSGIMIPAFGKLSYEIKMNIPIYTIRNTAEIQSSLDVDENPQLTAFLTSQGKSPTFEILNYNLDSNARIAIPKEHDVSARETLKFTHVFLAVDHQASVTFSDFSAQASLLNEAFLATRGGLSASADTSYKHTLILPGLTSDASATQKSVARQEGTSVTFTVENQGTNTYNSHQLTHKSDLQVIASPDTVKVTLTGDTDAVLLKMTQTLSADFAMFSNFKFDVRSEAEGPAIRKSLIEGSVNVNFPDRKLEYKATHSTDLVGIVSGALNNVIYVVVCPTEVVFSFQNKGNTRVSFNDALTAKIDLQNDYSANLRPDNQHINTVALARLNQYKLLWNFTVEHNDKEAALLAAVEGKANLDFLTRPISIPEIELPFVDFQTPAISNLNLYEQTGLKYVLTTPEQSVDADVKIVYQKSQADTLAKNTGLIPPMGNLITELSFKSAIINLNANAGMYTEDDLVFRLGATTASVFDSLKAKLDGTTSLTTKRGIKLANSLSLENPHMEGTHDSTISVSTETFDSAISVATVAKIALPILNLEANQNLVADTKTKANAVSTFRVTGNFNIPMIKAVGKADADHSLKMEGTFDYVSMESSIKGSMDGSVFEDYIVLGVLDNEANLYLNSDGLRSTSKVIADAKLNSGATKVIGMDVNENLAIEASLSRVYAVLKYIGNNEANMFNFNTKGKQNAQATIDFAPISSLTADIEIDMSQPTSLGDFTIYEKTVAEVTAAKQKISTNAKFASPLYTTEMTTEVEGSVPVFKVIYKSSATSPIVILEYDLDCKFFFLISDYFLVFSSFSPSLL
uniref:Vitellogenin domain-containing protein n=1 Tax=Stegastes partitus TaxID=144197 RepID=A0A3B5BN13_9TELE